MGDKNNYVWDNNNEMFNGEVTSSSMEPSGIMSSNDQQNLAFKVRHKILYCEYFECIGALTRARGPFNKALLLIGSAGYS